MQVKKNDMPIKEVLDRFVQQKKIAPGFLNSRIQQIWIEKLGHTVAKHTLSLKLVRSDLFIVMDSAPLKNEFHINREKLMTLLNNTLGSEVIKKIHIK